MELRIFAVRGNAARAAMLWFLRFQKCRFGIGKLSFLRLDERLLEVWLRAFDGRPVRLSLNLGDGASRLFLRFLAVIGVPVSGYRNASAGIGVPLPCSGNAAGRVRRARTGSALRQVRPPAGFGERRSGNLGEAGSAQPRAARAPAARELACGGLGTSISAACGTLSAT